MQRTTKIPLALLTPAMLTGAAAAPQRAPPLMPANEAWRVWGRRAGRSFALAFWWCSWRASVTDGLAPGERGTVVVIATDRNANHRGGRQQGKPPGRRHFD